MRARKGLLLIAVLAVALAPAAGLACDEASKAAGCAASACPMSGAKAATLAANADSGCQKSTEALIAMAQGASCSKTAALAAKAAEGDKEATAALIAIYKPTEDAEIVAAEPANGNAEPSMAQLAMNAENGCAKSTEALIAMAKESGCAKTQALAAKAEGGCQASQAALIAMYAQGDEQEPETETKQ